MNEWTIMVYMAGDNDLNEDMVKRLIEMRTIFDEKSGKIKTDRIGLCAYFDGDNPVIKTKRYNFTKGIVGEEIPGSGGSNSAAQLTIEDFVKWCVADQKVKAEKYALFISGHGDGFQQTSFLRDSTQSDSMTVRELKDAIKKINKTVLAKPKLDLLAFDSCVMNSIEVVNEFKEIAEILVGSQGYLPTTGWSYLQIVNSLIKLNKNQKVIISEDIAKALVKAAVEPNAQFSELTRRSLDMSILDPSRDKINPILNGINNLANALRNALKSQATAELDTLKRQPVKSAVLNAHWKCQTFLFDQSVDLIDFCDQLRAECSGTMFQIGTTMKYAGVELLKVTGGTHENVAEVEIADGISAANRKKYADVLDVLKNLQTVAKAARDLHEKADECILKCCFSGPDYQYLNGLSLFFPWSRNTFEMVRPGLNNFEFKSSKWIEFLEEYLNDTLRPPRAVLLKNNLSPLEFKTLAGKAAVGGAGGGGIMLDPPPAGQLVSNAQYKEYFARTKNFPLNDTGFCPKP